MSNDLIYISIYTLEQAIADGGLVEIFKSDWPVLTEGKPVVATATIVADIPEIELKKMLNTFSLARNSRINKEDWLFVSIGYNESMIWIVENAQSVTFMYPDEY